MRKLGAVPVAGALLFSIIARGQVTFPVNGITDARTGCYAFTNAVIVKDGKRS